MATLEILAAFALSTAFMLLLWSLRDRLLRPRRSRDKPLKLALFFEAENGGKARRDAQHAARSGAADPPSDQTEGILQDMRSDGYDGGNG